MIFSDNLRAQPKAADPDDLRVGELLTALEAAADLPLVFSYNGQDVKPGYHVTEIKVGRFEALDCGANPESWIEIFVQLWDVSEDGAHMPASKFLRIVEKVATRVELKPGARLTFEVSDGARPMQLYRAALPRFDGSLVRVDLSPRAASCKPRDRGLQARKCCSAPAGAQPCCG